MAIKETPCTLCRGTGEFKGKYITDCTDCQGTGFMWEMEIERIEEHEVLSIRSNESTR